MNISHLLRRALVHYSRCSGNLTLPPPDLEDSKPSWAKTVEPFYEESRFHPLTVQDPSFVVFPVRLQRNKDGTVSMIHAITGEVHMGKGLAFYAFPDDCDHAQLMECREKGNLLATAVVPDKVFEMVQPLFSRYEQFDALCSYCLMSKKDQDAVRHFLTDTESATSLFHCLCYLTSHLEGTDLTLDELDIPTLADKFNLAFAHQPGNGYADPGEMVALIESMQFSTLRFPEELFSILTFCAILNHRSRWQEQGSSMMNTMYTLNKTCDVHISFLLQWCCDADMLRTVIKHALYMEHRSDSNRNFFEKLALYCLTLETPLNPDIIEAVCTQMFRGELSHIRQNWIGNILTSPNGPYFQEFIQNQYQKLWQDGQYLQAMALIRCLSPAGKPELSSQNLMLGSQEVSESLLGAVMLAHYLELGGNSPVTLEREQEIVQVLSHWLLAPKSVCSDVAVRLLLALKIFCAVPRKAFCQTELLTKACQCFSEEDTRKYAVTLLGTAPLTHTVAAADSELFQEELKWHFSKSLEEDDFLYTILLFRSCIVSGCWDNAQILYNSRKLVSVEHSRHAGQTPSERHFMRQTREELFALLFRGTNPTTETAWQHLAAPFSNSMHHRLEEIQQLAGQEQPVYLTCSEDVMLVLRFLRNSGEDQKPQASVLVSHCVLAETVSDSCIVSWFWILCCWNRRKEAMAHYLAHRSLLDRPWRSVSGTCLPHDWRNLNFNHFLNTSSRLQMGIYLATLLGNSTLVREFLRSGLLDGPAVETTAKVLYDLDRCHLPEELKFLSRNQTDFLETSSYDHVRIRILQSMLPLNVSEFWRICWDDRGITRMVLSHADDSHIAILRLGYSGEKEIALAAIGFYPPCVHSLTPYLLKDDEIALTALRTSSFSIRSLQAPILQDHELVLNLLHENNVYPPLSMVPEWLCNNKTFVIHSLQKYPTNYFLVSSRLKEDPQVLIATMNALSEDQRSFVCNLLRDAAPVLRSNRQVMTRAVSLYPSCLRMADESLRYDPQLLALADSH